MFRKAWVISVWLHFQYCSVLFCQWHCGFRLVFGFLQPIKLTAAIQHSLHGVHHVTNLHLVRGKSVKVNPTVIWLWQRKPLNINIQTINTSCHYVHGKGHVNKWKFGAFLIKKIVKFLSENNSITIKERGKYLKVQRNCMQTAILIWLLVRRCGIICFVNMCCSVFSAHFMTNNNKFVNY